MFWVRFSVCHFPRASSASARHHSMSRIRLFYVHSNLAKTNSTKYERTRHDWRNIVEPKKMYPHSHSHTHALHARHRRVCLKMEEEVNRNSYAFFLSFFLCVLAQTVSTRHGARVCPRRYQTKTCASPKYVRIKWNWNRKANVRMDFRSSDFLFCFTFNACLRQIETLSSNEGGAKKTNLAFVLVAHSICYNRFNENWISSWRLQSR